MSPLFHIFFQYISNFRRQITYPFVKCGFSIYFFPNFAILICRGTDISKYFSKSPGLRDNEGRLYISDLQIALYSFIQTECRETIRIHFIYKITQIWTTPCKNVSSDICRQGRPRSACASAPSDLGLQCPLIESLETTECMMEEQRPG